MPKATEEALRARIEKLIEENSYLRRSCELMHTMIHKMTVPLPRELERKINERWRGPDVFPATDGATNPPTKGEA